MTVHGQAMARDVERALARAAVFAGLDAATISALAASATRRAWDAGTVLFQRGDAGEAQPARDRFARLDWLSQEFLVIFLRSL